MNTPQIIPAKMSASRTDTKQSTAYLLCSQQCGPLEIIANDRCKIVISLRAAHAEPRVRVVKHKISSPAGLPPWKVQQRPAKSSMSEIVNMSCYVCWGGMRLSMLSLGLGS